MSEHRISPGFLRLASVTCLHRVTCASCPTGIIGIAYLVKNDGNVDVLGVFHSALDITRYQL